MRSSLLTTGQRFASLGIQSDHESAFHVKGTGLTMSSSRKTLPFSRSRRSVLPSVTGTTRATGFPRLVTRMVSCLCATSSNRARHCALNFPAAMVFIPHLQFYDHVYLTLIILSGLPREATRRDEREQRRSRALSGLHDQHPIAEAGESLRRSLSLGARGEAADANPVVGLATDERLHDLDAGDLRL